MTDSRSGLDFSRFSSHDQIWLQLRVLRGTHSQVAEVVMPRFLRDGLASAEGALRCFVACSETGADGWGRLPAERLLDISTLMMVHVMLSQGVTAKVH